jgi:hypothetical protein
MINEKQILNKVLEEGQSQSSIGMSLDMESAQVLMQMLSKNLYSDPIGSTVRECASNALDSHRRAGVAEAIIVSLKVNSQNNYEFSVEDFGTGLDADDVENIISKYGKSTKRESATEIGMMGLGFKSPLAYSSSFYFVCRKDGVERKYMMYEGEDVNTIDLLYETPTDQRNGVKIIVPVKFQDKYHFRDKIAEQLAYFESVYFDVNVQNTIVTNEFQIHRSEHFQISELNGDHNVHICLDNVYYPLDFQKLGISIIPLPLGLRFGLSDGLFPTPNREQLIYSSQAKKLIKDKIDLVSEYFVQKYNENNIDCKNIKEIFTYYSNGARIVQIAGQNIDASKLVGFAKSKFIKPTYKKYVLTDFQNLYRNKDYMFYEYRTHIEFVRDKFRQCNGHQYHLSYNEVINDKRVFIYDELLVGNKKSYIKSLLPLNDWNPIKFVKKSKNLTLRNKSKNQTYDNYTNLLELYKYPKATWRARIKEFQEIIIELTHKFENADTINVPQVWLDARKKKRVSTTNGGTKRVKLQGEINCRMAEDLQRFVSNKNSKLVPNVLKVENIESTKQLNVYGKVKDEVLIDQLYSISANQKIKYFVLSEREHKVAETLDFHNFISIDKFMEGKNKPVKRLVTGHLIHELINKYYNVFQKVNIMQTVSKDLFEHLEMLKAYDKKNYSSIGDGSVYPNLVAIAEEHNLFDETIYTEYKAVKELLDNFNFIDTVMGLITVNYNTTLKPNQLQILVDLFKYNRIRIDYTNYKLVLNEDIIEPITEETIEQLTLNN